MNDYEDFARKIDRDLVGAWTIIIAFNMVVLGFVAWVIVKLLQHFSVI